ncbi:hypothetical protein BJ322DRAFT_1135060 [Thelephora terrestris]|uniref:DUF6830 domain-containing protein n=1 Tax=Thelephora terrestris TaxID=56493 RepID=A0A9P6HNV0_9AGAM|nr:hypothetical protein BJ322DRAFT_1148626 [Thelephora terrestris]KAF9790591.1 hypothetical protein BJ322DRAFT_1135060 [Thelephora terrestris]
MSIKYPFAGHIFNQSGGFMENFYTDKFSEERASNLHYPFASRGEWQLGSFLSRAELSLKFIDEFLSLDLIKGLGLSFSSARSLRARVELLPSGPRWLSREVSIPGFATKDPVVLYYRDSVGCMKFLLQNPIFANRIRFSPERQYDILGNRTYGDWVTSDGAWEMQEQVPVGTTVLGTILSSDKTLLSAMSGDRVAHPLLITAANIDSDVRMKASYNSLLLLALLPVPKFTGVPKPLHGILENRVIHACLDLICEPLKVVARHGDWMSDHAGNHPPRTASDILSPLSSLSSSMDPWNVAAYTKEAKTLYRLNGVDRPFWRDWILTTAGMPPNPHQIFPIEVLHHFHKCFWDHDVKWCIRAVGEDEINFRFALLQPRCGYRRFPAGISALKQVTGREHRNIQRYILGIIAGAAPLEFIVCIRALLDIRYLAQMRRVTTEALRAIGDALQTFHRYKDIIITGQYRVGKKNKPILHFEIPKLELLQSVVACIQWSGSLPQWSADSTEHSHGKFVKKPKLKTNGIEYYSQICRHLDRDEKVRMFDIATSTHESASAGSLGSNVADFDDFALDMDEWSAGLPAVGPDRAGRKMPDFFSVAAPILPSDSLTSPVPRTFSTATTGFHFNLKPNVPRAEVNDVAEDFNIPGLYVSIRDFLSHYLYDQDNRRISGRQGPTHGTVLPFDGVQVWHSVQVQNFNCDGMLRPPQRLFASPPSDDWPSGRCDTVLFRESVDPRSPQRPGLGLSGFFVGQIRLIFHPIWTLKTKLPFYLAYVQRFDIVSQPYMPRGQQTVPDPITGMYVLRRARRSDGSPMGAIIPFYHCHMPVNLIPKFGESADPYLTAETSMEDTREFFLNHYFDVEDFFHLRSSL